jgi:hypothetical protein
VPGAVSKGNTPFLTEGRGSCVFEAPARDKDGSKARLFLNPSTGYFASNAKPARSKPSNLDKRIWRLESRFDRLEKMLQKLLDRKNN